MTSSPFDGMKIDDWHGLDLAEGRIICPKCNRSRKYFCYTCCCPLRELEHLTPTVKLPVDIDIIKHPQEVDGKSTACHAAVVSPDHVHIYTYPVIPHYDVEKTLLIFPGENSVRLEDLVDFSGCQNGKDKEEISSNNIMNNRQQSDSAYLSDSNKKETSSNSPTSNEHKPDATAGHNVMQKSNSANRDTSLFSPVHEHKHSLADEDPNSCAVKRIKCEGKPTFNRAVFIDSTWNQTFRIVDDERLKGLKRLELTTRTSRFWRTQKGKPDTHLSTIEAIYYFVRDFHEIFIETPYTGQYDNLLFFFSFLYHKINRVKHVKLNGES